MCGIFGHEYEDYYEWQTDMIYEKCSECGKLK